MLSLYLKVWKEYVFLSVNSKKGTAPALHFGQTEHTLALLFILYIAERPDLLLNPAECVCFTSHNPLLSFLYCDRCETGFKTLAKSSVFLRKSPRTD